jgi:hypothetical protein
VKGTEVDLFSDVIQIGLSLKVFLQVIDGLLYPGIVYVLFDHDHKVIAFE